MLRVLPAHHAWNCILFYFLLLIICTENFTRSFHYIMTSHNVFFFEFENDGMEPSKRHSFISLLFILNHF